MIAPDREFPTSLIICSHITICKIDIFCQSATSDDTQRQSPEVDARKHRPASTVIRVECAFVERGLTLNASLLLGDLTVRTPQD